MKLPLDAPAASGLFAAQVIVPVPPTAGVVPHVQPAGGVIETKVVPGGVVCVSVTCCAGTTVELFVTAIV
jgi:hypothetical protein